MQQQVTLSTQPFPGSKDELLQAMLAAFSESVFLFDTFQKRLTFISQHLLAALGYPPGTGVPSEIMEEWLHPDDRQPIRLLSIKVVKGETAVGAAAIRIRHFNGTYRWFSLKVVIFDRSALPRPHYLFGVLVDIHTRKEADIRIRRQNEAIQQYTFTASHIIRAPLANILGLVNLLRSLPKSNRDEREQLQEMLQDCAVTLDTVITDLIRQVSASRYST